MILGRPMKVRKSQVSERRSRQKASWTKRCETPSASAASTKDEKVANHCFATCLASRSVGMAAPNLSRVGRGVSGGTEAVDIVLQSARMTGDEHSGCGKGNPLSMGGGDYHKGFYESNINCCTSHTSTRV